MEAVLITPEDISVIAESIAIYTFCAIFAALFLISAIRFVFILFVPNSEIDELIQKRNDLISEIARLQDKKIKLLESE
ncbi:MULTISPECIES: hypothetical protein [Vibrio]|uniref:hypothetical protein n=1 Tax=Vibrio TaxID=662 RepID=UPI000D73090B|nr:MULTISPECIES: hypothetical protein [Vibrio]PXA73730.1 hypothetical protein DMC15_06670 [Vibrio sp. 11986-1-5]